MAARAAWSSAKSIFKFFAISIVVTIVLRAEEAVAVNALFGDPTAVPEMILTTAMRLVSTICIATIVLVALDLAWARFHWRRELRMTKQELKDEFKQAEGDPLIKARLRSLARDRARKTMLAAVPRATLVIANPTHFAIALKYKHGEDAAPTVLAKGQDLIALKIREIAEQNNVPVVEDKMLARSMYDAVQVDQVIPAEFFRPVAEIIYFLHSRKQKDKCLKSAALRESSCASPGQVSLRIPRSSLIRPRMLWDPFISSILPHHMRVGCRSGRRRSRRM